MRGLGLSALASNLSSEHGSISLLPEMVSTGATAYSGADTTSSASLASEMPLSDLIEPLRRITKSPGAIVAPGPSNTNRERLLVQTHEALCASLLNFETVPGSRMSEQLSSAMVIPPPLVSWSKSTVIEVPIESMDMLSIPGAFQ